jgi:3-methyladenine DNA glycosylase/8-oxoguanine DNA glycosylase
MVVPRPGTLAAVATVRRSLTLPGPVSLRLTLWRLPHGALDPAVRVSGTEAWRATRTAEGPAAVHLRIEAGRVEAEAAGSGAEAALEALPGLLGVDDRPEEFVPRHPTLAALARRLAGLRLGRTGAVLEALVPAVLEQKVPGVQARGAHAALLRTAGEPAPSLHGGPRLLVPPSPERLAALPYHAFHPLGVERRRAEVIREVARHAARLEATAALPPADAGRILRALPGVGAWTAAEVAATAYGDPDAVSVGDFHLPHLVSWALAGEPRGDDARMLELLEPFRGQRQRVIRLIEAANVRPPRFGPRLRLQPIARI